MTSQVENKTAAELGFADLIAPVNESEFFAEYWEKKPLVGRGHPPDFFVPLFSIADVDRYIFSARPKAGSLDLVTAQGFVSDNYLNPDGTASVNLVREGYLKGSTIILSAVEESWHPLAVFAAALEAQINHPVAMAVYLTPPNFQGVKPHYDTQENFLLQVEGTKSWKVYNPVYQLPPVEGSYSPVPREKIGAPILETELHPGEALYIPRGFIHEGVAGDRPSLHITVDIHVRTWSDILSDALKAAADRDPRLRASLTPGFLNSDGGAEALRAQFDEYLEILRQNACFEDALGKHVEALAVRKPPPGDGHFSGLFIDVHPHTRLRRRSTSVQRLFQSNGYAGMQFSGNQITGPAKIAEALRFIAANRDFTAASLPNSLSENEKLVLVRRLVRTGLLMVVE